MRKIIAVIFLFVITFSTVSCSKSTEKITNSTETVTKSEIKSAAKPKVKKSYGIDVSSFNGKIDWKKVKKDNIDFAMIRIGGRGYGESGAIYKDENAMYNLKAARKNKIKTGVYFFSQAASKKEAEEEAKYVVNALGSIKISLPIGYDVERIKGDTSRIDKVPYKESVKYAKVFMKTIHKYGYEPMVYIGEDSILKKEDFKKFDIWYAKHSCYPENENFKMCQYSKDGKVKGIKGNVDLDILYI